MSFGLVIIMKNEEVIIKTCLESVYKYISYWTICDTGSTDDSCKIVEDFFKEKNIPGQLLHHEWVGFAHNRSLAFAAAEDKTTWMYVIDCDDYLLTPLEIPQYCEDADSLVIVLEEGPYTTQNRQQIFRSGLKWGYAAAVHEFPFSRKKEHLNVMKTDKIRVRASRGGDRSKDPLKYWKDAQLMEVDLLRIQKIPKHKLPHWEKQLESRYHHYIAQSYHDFHDWETCIKWCDTRIALNDFKEEIYRAYLMKARCLRNLKRPHRVVIEALEQAKKYDPFRSEHLYDIAREYDVMHWEHCENIKKLNGPVGISSLEIGSLPKDKSKEETDELNKKINKEKAAAKAALEKAWENINLIFQIKRPKDKMFIVEDFVYTVGKLELASNLAAKMEKWELAYKYAHMLWEQCNPDQTQNVWRFKHITVDKLLEIFSPYKPIKNIHLEPNDPNVKPNRVFNLTWSSTKSSQVALSTFFSTILDYINIDMWYISKDDPELMKLFPFLKVGRGTGEKITINVDDHWAFFHKFNLFPFLDKAVEQVVPKILYLNRQGNDNFQLEGNVDKGLFKLKGVVNSPYVVFASGQGIWSNDFLVCKKQ